VFCFGDGVKRASDDRDSARTWLRSEVIAKSKEQIGKCVLKATSTGDFPTTRSRNHSIDHRDSLALRPKVEISSDARPDVENESLLGGEYRSRDEKPTAFADAESGIRKVERK